MYALAALKIASPSLKRAAERIEADASRRAALGEMVERLVPARSATDQQGVASAVQNVASAEQDVAAADQKTPPAGQKMSSAGQKTLSAGPKERPHGDTDTEAVNTARPRRSPFGMRRRRGGWAIN